MGLVQEALTTRPHFSEDLLVVRKAQLEGVSHPFQSQSGIWIDFSGFFRGFLTEPKRGPEQQPSSAGPGGSASSPLRVFVTIQGSGRAAARVYACSPMAERAKKQCCLCC